MTTKRMLSVAAFAATVWGFVLFTPSAVRANGLLLCTSFNGQTLATVISSFAGCIIDDKIFQAISGSTNLGSATVTFVDTPFNPGLDLTNINLSVGPGQTVDFSLSATLTVNPGGNLIDDFLLLGLGTKEGDSTLFGTFTSNVTIISQSPPNANPFEVTFVPTNTVSGSGTFTAEGNTGSSFIAGTSFRWSEVSVPEPASFTLMETGLLGLAVLMRRTRMNRKV